MANLRTAGGGTMVQFDVFVSASAKRTASTLAAGITELLRTGSAVAFANQPTLALLVPGDYTIRNQPVMSARSRRDLSDTDDTVASTTLQEQLNEVQRKLAAAEAAHAEERAMLQAAHAEEKAALTHLLDTASEEKAMLQTALSALTQLLDTASEEKAAWTQTFATDKDYTPWFIAIACIQVRVWLFDGILYRCSSKLDGSVSMPLLASPAPV